MTEEGSEYSLTISLTRGNGTDDRDKLKATVEAESLDELDERIEAVRDRLETVAQEVRGIQPAKGRRTAEDQASLSDIEEEGSA